MARKPILIIEVSMKPSGITVVALLGDNEPLADFNIRIDFIKGEHAHRMMK